ncbi:MAG: MgtC/SapB family protein [Verrucomicrobiales bacterium]|nr:MgtC/SapB family protein [Verrucomicrobiales bacterium]
MELPEAFKQLVTALGLGLLVGLQRERTDARLAGFRTFPLITLLGALCAMLAQEFGGWILAVGMASLAVVIIVGNLPALSSKNEPGGVTTEVAMLVMFAVGGCLMADFTTVAIAVAGTVAVLLHLKPEMHALAAKIGENDFKAMMQFVLVTLVVLPVLPNEFYGPYRVLNPYKIWLMVVLIVGISLGGYIIYKFIGPKAGVWAGGVLGGLISSTATTVSYARRSRQNPDSSALAAFVVLVASAIVFVRVLVLITVTAPRFLPSAIGPISVMFLAMATIALWNGLRDRAESAPMPEQGNPSELKAALFFALIYGVVLVATAAGREFFGQGGVYAVAVLSGLTDMDAITLSMTQMVGAEQVSPGTGWRCILVASMSNLAFKAATVAILGSRRLFQRTAVSFGAVFVAGVLLLVFWE